MTISHRSTARSWGHRMGVAAGTAAAAATIPLLATATAHADATTDLLTIPDISGLVDISTLANVSTLADADVSIAAAPTTIAGAIAAALVPITTASTQVDAALDLSGLSAADLSILNGQDAVLNAQGDLLDQLVTFQTGLTSVDATDLASLDSLLTTANQSILEATTGFIGTLDEPVTSQLTAALDLLTADFGAIGTDLNVIGISASADFLGLIGIDPSFLFDGLAAGI